MEDAPGRGQTVFERGTGCGSLADTSKPKSKLIDRAKKACAEHLSFD